jgi:hypothetical protein
VIITRCGRPIARITRETGDFQSGRTLLGVTFVNPFAPAGLPAEVERLLGPPQR